MQREDVGGPNGPRDTRFRMRVNGIEVAFPPGITPYKSQKRIIVRMITSLCDPKKAMADGIYESATGTGKSLALLAGACSWLAHVIEHKSDGCVLHGGDSGYTGSGVDSTECTCAKVPRIYFCTKTTAQLKQVVAEYNRLPFHKDGRLRHTVLSSRKNLCVNSQVLGTTNSRSSADVSGRCLAKLDSKGGGCAHYTRLMANYGKKTPTLRSEISDALANEAFDVEDLPAVLKNSKCGSVCPYYAATELLAIAADITFCTYSHVWDPLVREFKKIDICGAVLIVDECHNLTDVCCETVTFDFNLHRLRLLVTELANCVRHAETGLGALSDDEQWAPVREAFRARLADLRQIQRCVYGLIGFAEQRLRTLWSMHGERYHGQPRMVATLDDDTFRRTITSTFYEEDDVEEAAGAADTLTPLGFVTNAFWATCRLLEREPICLRAEDDAGTKPIRDSLALLMRMFYAISYYIPRYVSEYKCSFEVELDRCGIMHHADAFENLIQTSTKVAVRFWPLSAAACFRNVVDHLTPRALFLASGTLSPIEPFYAELKYTFSVSELELPSVVPAEQIFAAAVVRGPFDHVINGTLKNTPDENSPFYKEVAGVITGVCRIVPAGVICFLPSYAKLQFTLKALEKCGLMRTLKAYKEVCVENESDVTEDALSRHRDVIARGKGSLLLAVFRGRVSEGINLTGDLARCIIVPGIPFANKSDEYVGIRAEANGGFIWLKRQAFVAVCQGIGRSLRNCEDWSAFLFLDERYDEEEYRKYLPYWVRCGMKTVEDKRRLGPLLKDFCLKFGPLQTEPPSIAISPSQFLNHFKQPPVKKAPVRKKAPWMPPVLPKVPVPPKEQCVVLVGNLNGAIEQADLISVFGRVDKICFMRGWCEEVKSKKPRKGKFDVLREDCFTYIQFQSPDGARRAVELLDGAKVDPFTSAPLTINEHVGTDDFPVVRPLSVRLMAESVTFDGTHVVVQEDMPEASA